MRLDLAKTYTGADHSTIVARGAVLLSRLRRPAI
jgi:hypothetical protein